MAFIECEVRVEDKCFSPLKPCLVVLKGEEFPLAAALAMEHSHEVGLNVLAYVQIDLDCFQVRH